VRTAVITGSRKAAVVAQPEPVARHDIVKVELRVVPMCTEFKNYEAGNTTQRLGHEASGVVVDPGASQRVAKGDRVVVMPQFGCGKCSLCTSGDHIFCSDQRDVLAETGSLSGTGTFGEYLIKPDWLLVPVPVDVSLRHAAMACCALGPSFNAMKAMRVSVGDTLLVVGCGPVGLGAVINGVARGARVIALEINRYRAQLAEKVGAAAVFNPSQPDVPTHLLDLTEGGGVSAVFDSSGVPALVPLVEQLVRPRARLSFVVLNQTVELRRLVTTGLEVHGCWHWNHQRDASEMFEVIRSFRTSLDAIITHSFSLEQVEEAFRAQLSGECGKVLLFPFGEGLARD
jgi:L-iditol 2-dehydrogenase